MVPSKKVLRTFLFGKVPTALLISFLLLAFSSVFVCAQTKGFKVRIRTIPDSMAVFYKGEYEGKSPVKIHVDGIEPDSANYVRLIINTDDLHFLDTIARFPKRSERILNYSTNRFEVYFSDIDTLYDFSAFIKKPRQYSSRIKIKVGNILVDLNQGDYATGKEFKTIVETECEKAGMKVIGKLNLFEDENPEKEDANYILAATITKMFNNYNKFVQIIVSWQLYDRVKKEVILTKSIYG